MDSGKVDSGMVMENRYGQMELSMLDNGGRTKLMDREDLCMWMETFMMASGLMTKLMGQEFISM